LPSFKLSIILSKSAYFTSFKLSKLLYASFVDTPKFIGFIKIIESLRLFSTNSILFPFPPILAVLFLIKNEAYAYMGVIIVYAAI